MKNILLLINLAWALTLPASPASASPIHVEFAGTVSYIGPDLGALGVAIGDTASESFDLQLSTPDDQADPAFGSYLGAISNFRITIGSLVYTSPSAGNVNVGNNTPGDYISYFDSGLTGLGAGLFVPDYGSAFFYGGAGLQNLLTSDALPSSFDPLAFISSHNAEIAFNRRNSTYESIVFTVTSVTITSVPEPSSLALVALALGGIGFSRRKRV